MKGKILCVNLQKGERLREYENHVFRNRTWISNQMVTNLATVAASRVLIPSSCHVTELTLQHSLGMRRGSLQSLGDFAGGALYKKLQNMF